MIPTPSPGEAVGQGAHPFEQPGDARPVQAPSPAPGSILEIARFRVEVFAENTQFPCDREIETLPRKIGAAPRLRAEISSVKHYRSPGLGP